MRNTARNLTVLGLGLSVSAAVGWLLLRNTKRRPASNTTHIYSQTAPNTVSEVPQIVLPLDPVEDVPQVSPTGAALQDEPNDLTQINDIGPKFAQALNAIGITRFEQLAQETPEGLAEKLTSHVTVRAQRILDNDWIGQAARLAQN